MLAVFFERLLPIYTRDGLDVYLMRLRYSERTLYVVKVPCHACRRNAYVVVVAHAWIPYDMNQLDRCLLRSEHAENTRGGVTPV